MQEIDGKKNADGHINGNFLTYAISEEICLLYYTLEMFNFVKESKDKQNCDFRHKDSAASRVFLKSQL